MNSKFPIAMLFIAAASIGTLLFLFGCATTEMSRTNGTTGANGIIDQAAFTEQFVAECKAKAEAGDIDGQAQYGLALLNGWGVETNYASAVEWLGKAAVAGNAIGQYGVGFCYLSGKGVPKDAAEAVKWYRKAAEQGHVIAQHALGRCYEQGTGVEKDETKAVEWCRKAAEHGYALAQYDLGTCYHLGKGVPKDAAKAVTWYRKAAEQGLASAQQWLGDFYRHGIGVPENAAEAVKWYRKAAEQGHWLAQTRLAMCYKFGYGVEKDEAKAAEWDRKADEGIKKTKKGISSWTAKATERYWTAVANNSTRITTAPRRLAADAQKGEGMLEAFGTQYMPNAYDNYEKVRAKAIEREQLLKEKFPEGEKSDTTGGALYRKIALAAAKAVSEYFRRHDELCHFYLMHKAGVMTDAELARLDEAKICVMLPLAGEKPEGWKMPAAPKPGELDFARQYKPETFSAYERLKAVFDEGEKQYASLLRDAAVLDAVRYGGVLAPLALRLAEVSGRLQGIAKTLSEEKLLHEVEELTAEKLADSDAKFGIEIRAFEKTLPVRDYAKDWFAKNWTEREWGSVAYRVDPLLGLPFTMVPIPGKNYAMCKYEATQALWEAVMGENPSRFKGVDHPVEEVSWNDCQKFLEKLNALPEVKASGRTYRLPTMKEWEFACRAGATRGCPQYIDGKVVKEVVFCKLADGRDIVSWDTLDEVAWYHKNTGFQTYPIGQKKPNAFGLYDMYGNVEEKTSDGYVCGGSFRSYNIKDSNHDPSPGYTQPDLGFRLASGE